MFAKIKMTKENAIKILKCSDKSTIAKALLFLYRSMDTSAIVDRIPVFGEEDDDSFVFYVDTNKVYSTYGKSDSEARIADILIETFLKTAKASKLGEPKKEEEKEDKPATAEEDKAEDEDELEIKDEDEDEPKDDDPVTKVLPKGVTAEVIGDTDGDAPTKVIKTVGEFKDALKGFGVKSGSESIPPELEGAVIEKARGEIEDKAVTELLEVILVNKDGTAVKLSPKEAWLFFKDEFDHSKFVL